MENALINALTSSLKSDLNAKNAKPQINALNVVLKILNTVKTVEIISFSKRDVTKNAPKVTSKKIKDVLNVLNTAKSVTIPKPVIPALKDSLFYQVENAEKNALLDSLILKEFANHAKPKTAAFAELIKNVLNVNTISSLKRLTEASNALKNVEKDISLKTESAINVEILTALNAPMPMTAKNVIMD